MSWRAIVLAAMLAAMCFAGEKAAAQGNPFSPGAKPAETAAPAQAAPSAASLTGGGYFADLQRQVSKQLNQRLSEINRGSPSAVLIGVALAFLYGVFHAAGPGHGKVVVMSYFLGRDAHPWRGVLMGGQIALVHVGGAIVIAVLATLILTGAGPPSVEDMREVKLASYAAVAAIGAWLLIAELSGQGHAHHHDHGHAHDHGRDHAHDHGQDNRRGGIALSLVAGAVPCTGAVLVLLYAIANNIPVLGLVLVLMIGLGMAATLAGFGLVGMFARRRALAYAKRGEKQERPARWRRVLDLGAPVLIVLLGVALFIGAY